MYCENCGAEIKDGNQFCTKCGAKVIGDTDFNTFDFNKKIDEGIFNNTNTIQTNDMDLTRFNTGTTTLTGTGQYIVEEKPKKKKTWLIILLVSLLLLLLAGGGFAGYYFFLRQKNVDPTDFVSIKVDDKLEGYASAEVEINYNKLTNLIGYKNLKRALVNGMSEKDLKNYQKEKDFKIDTATETRAGKDALNAENFIVAEIGNTSNLSNGDEIVIKFSPAEGLDYSDFEELMKALKIKLDDSYVYTVSGLESGKKINVLIPDVEKYVTFYGIEGSGNASLNINNQKYTFEKEYEVTVNNNIGQVYKNGGYIGTLEYRLATMNGEPELGKLSEGDDVAIMALPDDKLVEELINEKLSIEQNATSVKVGKLGSYVEPSSLSSKQLIDVSEDAVLFIRNSYHEGCPALKGIYSMKEKNSNNTSLGYLFRLNTGEHYFVHQQAYMSADGSSVTTGEPVLEYLGNSSDPTSKMSAYELTQISDPGVASEKYAKGKYILVVVRGLNVRSGPGVNYDRVKINGKYVAYDEGEVLEVIDETRDVDNDLWYKVRLTRNGKEYEYWASGMHVEIYPTKAEAESARNNLY